MCGMKLPRVSKLFTVEEGTAVTGSVSLTVDGISDTSETTFLASVIGSGASDSIFCIGINWGVCNTCGVCSCVYVWVDVVIVGTVFGDAIEENGLFADGSTDVNGDVFDGWIVSVMSVSCEVSKSFKLCARSVVKDSYDCDISIMLRSGLIWL